MGFREVWRGEQSVGSWLTGRDVRESDLAVKQEQAEETIAEITKIANNIPSMGNAMSSALATLNGTKGMSFIGGFQLPGLESAVDTIEAQVRSLGSLLDKRLTDAKYYDSPWYSKALGTAGMVLAKAGEGFLGAFEDIGDGVVSVVGWGVSKVVGVFNEEAGHDVQHFVENVVKADIAHDIADWAVYSRDWAKSSAITEDSAIAGACEIAGKAAGYLYAGGLFNGLSGLQAAEKAGNAGKIATKLLAKASSSTLSATAVAGIGGLGSGTEAGLYKGKTLGHALVTDGALTAGVSAALAFGGGKLGERLAKGRAVRSMAKAADKADDALNTAKKAAENADDIISQSQDTIESLTRKKLLGGLTEAEQAELKAAQESLNAATTANSNLARAVTEAADAHAAVDAVKNTALHTYQGYNDAITNAGLSRGNAIRTSLGSLQNTVSNSVSRLVHGEHSTEVLKATSDAAASGGRVGATGPTLETFEKIASTPVTNGLRDLGKGVVDTAKAVVATPGGLAMGAAAVADEAINDHAEDQFRETGKVYDDGKVPERPESVTGNGTTPSTTRTTTPEVPVPQPETPAAETPAAETPPTTQPITTQPPTTQPQETPRDAGPSREQPKPETPKTPTEEPVVTVEPEPTQQPTTPPQSQTETPPVAPDSFEHEGTGYSSDGIMAGDDDLETPLEDDVKTSLDDIIKGNKYNKIPSSSKPLGRPTSIATAGGSIIPISAGLSAAAAAGLGAKAYISRKERNDEDEEFVEGWTGEDNVAINPEELPEEEIDYNDSSKSLQSQIIESMTGEDMLNE